MAMAKSGLLPQKRKGDDGWHLYTGEIRYHPNVRKVRAAPGVSVIESHAFADCKHLTQVDFSGVRKIGFGAFQMCTSLTTIFFPEGIEEIGENAFVRCSSLGVIHLPCSLKTIGEMAFLQCTSLKMVKTAPPVRSISNHAFQKCTISRRAFEKCTSLTVVELPEGLEHIGGSTFHLCTALKEISIPSSVVKIEENAFSRCYELTKVDISGVRIICRQAFWGCKRLTTVLLPWMIEEIERAAFADCTSLEAIQLPCTVKTIGPFAFCGCTALKSVNIPTLVKEIACHTFDKCTSLAKIDLSEGVECFEGESFRKCTALKDIKIPRSVKEIKQLAFCECSSLEKIKLPEGLQVARRSAFKGQQVVKGGAFIHGFIKTISIPSPSFVVLDGLYKCRYMNFRSNSIRSDQVKAEVIIMSSCVKFMNPRQLVNAEERINEILSADMRRNYYRSLEDTRRYMRMVRGQLPLHIIDPDPLATFSTIPHVKSQEAINQLRTLFSHFESVEATNVLELAIWKAKMGKNAGKDRAARQSCRKKYGSDMNIIIAGVSSFFELKYWGGIGDSDDQSSR